MAQGFLYPRTISIVRPTPASGVGFVGYSGDTAAGEQSIAANVSANIEIASSGRNSAAGGIPSDSPGPIKWTVTLPASALTNLPLVMERDVIYDDFGRRFQVSAYQPSPLGARIDTVRLEA